MRILHVTTLITPDGAFGGPVRVATNQVRALRERGHDAVLVAAASGFDTLPTVWDGVPVRTFRAVRAAPGTGFAGIAAPGMVRWLRSNATRLDVAHVHLARDLVTLPAARVLVSAGRPLVTQTHGMVMPSRHVLSRPLDHLLTRRVVTEASTNLVLTDTEEAGLKELFADAATIDHLANGVPAAPPAAAELPQAPPREVLFLARLHRRKRPLAFVRMAADLAPRFPGVRFSLVGPDEGEGPQVTAAIAGLPPAIRHQVVWEGALPPGETLARLAAADLYVLPSVDEPFPMSVLEAMSAGTPVVVTSSCGLAPAIARARAGVVLSEDEQELPVAVARLLSDAPLRATLGREARTLVESSYSVDAVAALLEQHYTRAVASRSARRPARTSRPGGRDVPLSSRP
ncbi:MAG: hypothetical protein K0S43_286 [Cellulosimicrobium sp.]|jgi:glycosyltransferase involved in cell wall biosynthesis|nr:hypothetical protein [Cellulosimicrobium sp.]